MGTSEYTEVDFGKKFNSDAKDSQKLKYNFEEEDQSRKSSMNSNEIER